MIENCCLVDQVRSETFWLLNRRLATNHALLGYDVDVTSGDSGLEATSFTNTVQTYVGISTL